MIRRGDIYFLREHIVTGNVQNAGRPVVIISNNANNTHSKTVNVIPLTSKQKKSLPTHIELKENSIALCEQITTVSVEDLENHLGHLDNRTMRTLMKGLMYQLGIIE